MKLKVVFHIDEAEKWERLVGNVRNFLKEESDADLIVLANGNAVVGYLENSLEYKDILALMEVISLKACNNSLIGNNISRTDLDGRIEVVPSGVVSLALLQSEGYYYIKP